MNSQDPQDQNAAQGGAQNGNAQPAQNGFQNGAQNGSQEYEQLKAELMQTQNKLQEMMNISQRALADLQNFKRRAEEDRSSFIQYANAELMLELLPAIDNIGRALLHEPKDSEWVKGVEQIFKQLTQILEKKNLKVIPTVGQKFDPNLHEALMTGPGEKDMITEEFEKGYMLGDRVIKRPRVKVGDGSAN